MTLLSLSLVPVVVLNNMVPAVVVPVVVLLLSIVQYLIVSLTASFKKTNVGFAPLIFLKSRYLAPGTSLPLKLTLFCCGSRPALPSIITLREPFKRIIPCATEPDIVLTDALEGTMVKVYPPTPVSLNGFRAFVPSSVRSDVITAVILPETVLALIVANNPPAPVNEVYVWAVPTLTEPDKVVALIRYDNVVVIGALAPTSATDVGEEANTAWFWPTFGVPARSCAITKY